MSLDNHLFLQPNSSLVKFIEWGWSVAEAPFLSESSRQSSVLRAERVVFSIFFIKAGSLKPKIRFFVFIFIISLLLCNIFISWRYIFISLCYKIIRKCYIFISFGCYNFIR